MPAQLPRPLRSERRGQLAERLAGNEFDRDAVRGERVCDLQSGDGARALPAPGKDAPPSRLWGSGKDKRSRVGALTTPATLALDHPPPEGDAPNDLVDDTPSRPGWVGNRSGRPRGRRGRVDATATALNRRGVRRHRWAERPVGPLTETAEGDRLGPRLPDHPVAWRAEAKGALDFDHEPATPADGRYDIVRCAHPVQRVGPGTCSGSAGASAGRSCSGASSGSSRGTGSSSGSTVYVRRGSPISIALIANSTSRSPEWRAYPVRWISGTEGVGSTDHGDEPLSVGVRPCSTCRLSRSLAGGSLQRLDSTRKPRKLTGTRHEEVGMCWSKHEREEWERLQREREAERLRTISAIEPAGEEPDTPVEEVEEREGELIRI
jgi:hypothetical protein